MSQERIEISVVAPVFNEIENLRPLTDKINQAMTEHFASFEIIYIDDGSTDGSSELLDELAKDHANIRVFHFTENNGQTAAFAAGFDKAEGQLVLTLDADMQVDPADVGRLLPLIKDYDLVCGVRTERQDSIVKKFSSWVGNGVRNWLTHETIQDTGCPLKLFKREVVKRYTLFEGMHRFFPTLAKMNGFRVAEVPVNHFPRRFGRSKYGILNRAWKGLKDALAVRWMQKRMIRYKIR